MKKSTFSKLMLILGGIAILLILALTILTSINNKTDIDLSTNPAPITADTPITNTTIPDAIEAEISSLANSFNNIDNNNDLQLTIEEFIRTDALNIESTVVPEEMTSELAQLYQAYDDNQDQALNTMEFTYFMTTDENGDLKPEIGAYQDAINSRIIFVAADEDYSGSLDIDELRNIIETLNGTHLTMADALAMIAEADQNNDGILNITEFNILY